MREATVPLLTLGLVVMVMQDYIADDERWAAFGLTNTALGKVGDWGKILRIKLT